MMKAAQAKRLFLLVQRAKATNFQLPDGNDLAALLYPGKSIGPSQVRAANAVVHRLAKYGCIRKKGGTRHIHQAHLVTERFSAEFVLFFRQLCLASPPEYTIHEEHLRGQAAARFAELDFDGIFQHALVGRYITRVDGTPNLLRIGEKLNAHLQYLELFLEDRKK
jgi:hypothetical protein